MSQDFLVSAMDPSQLDCFETGFHRMALDSLVLELDFFRASLNSLALTMDSFLKVPEYSEMFDPFA